VIAADVDVEIAEVAGVEALQQPLLADRVRRELGATRPPNGIDRHADGGPGRGHGPMLSARPPPTIYSS
jgi:hypothetical protein